MIKLEDLTPGMELTGTVLNVVDFGCFVDIGMHDSGLVHVSQLADKFVRDPHDVVAVGDIVKVWVHGDRQGAAARVADDDSAGHRAPSGRPKREKRGGKRRRPAAQSASANATGTAVATAVAIDTPPAETAAAAPAVGEIAPVDRRPRRPERRRPDRPSGPRRQRGGARRRTQIPGCPPRQRKPKPVVPLTNEMKAGKAPLRTFGDLKQFFELKTQDGDAPEPQPPDAGG